MIIADHCCIRSFRYSESEVSSQQKPAVSRYVPWGYLSAHSRRQQLLELSLLQFGPGPKSECE